MSYDLMVFERSKAPDTKEEFLVWFEEQTEWAEEHSYDDPSVASEALQNWYQEMIKTFPPMDGSDEIEDEEIENDDNMEAYLTDYSVGSDIIYAAFSWSLADPAYELMLSLAQKHGVGFFDVGSTDLDIILPDGMEIN